MVQNGLVRPGARAIIINSDRSRFLVEKNHGAREQYLNFIGGGVELGETLEACIRREIQEETNAKIIRSEYLFVVENFVEFKGEITHGHGHYFEVELDRMDVRSDFEGIDFIWLSIKELPETDLRPHVVRDHIVNGSYRSVRHMISRDTID